MIVTVTMKRLACILGALWASHLTCQAQTDFVAGATNLSSVGAGLYVFQTGTVNQTQNLMYTPSTSKLTIGASHNRFELVPLGAVQHGAIFTRSTTANSPAAWDIFPNTDSTKGAWLDVCVDDLNQVTFVPWRCVVAHSTLTGYFLGAHHLDYRRTPSKPLYIGGSTIDFRYVAPQTQITFQESGLTAFDAITVRPYFSILKFDRRMRVASNIHLSWSPSDSVYDTNDVGIIRRTSRRVQATNGSQEYGAVDALSYRVGSVTGLAASCLSGPTSLTIRNGIIILATCP
jgi:hypothetical protein